MGVCAAAPSDLQAVKDAMDARVTYDQYATRESDARQN